MAKSNAKGQLQVSAPKAKDPSIAEIGDPSNLNNYLPDSGATQHMTPRLAGLVDTVEGQNRGVEVADGHLIRCSITGYIPICMQDDHGIPFLATFSEVMCVPGLSRRLFLITQFAQHGHHAIVQQQGTTLLFGSKALPVTIPYHMHGQRMASNLTVISPNTSGQDPTYHNIPAYRNKDQNKKRLPLELLHFRLGHCKCRTLLAASEHNL
jgi:hypothetical protein